MVATKVVFGDAFVHALANTEPPLPPAPQLAAHFFARLHHSALTRLLQGEAPKV